MKVSVLFVLCLYFPQLDVSRLCIMGTAILRLCPCAPSELVLPLLAGFSVELN